MADLDDVESRLSSIEGALIGIDSQISATNILLADIVTLMKELIQEVKTRR